MVFEIKITIDFDSKKQSDIFFKSIKPELEEKFNKTDTRVSQKGNKIGFEVRAVDKSSARASLNSIMKPLKLLKKLEEL